MTLRRLYAFDGWLMLAVGLLFWGGHPQLGAWFAIDTSGPFMEHFNLWKAFSFSGAFGGAMMAFGFATLAVSRSADAGFHRACLGYFLAAHCFLGFVLFAKQEALWDTTAGLILLDLVALPGAAFLYFLLTGQRQAPPQTERERRIREAAGQEERNRLAQDLHDSVKQQIYSVQTNLATAQARWDGDAAGAREAVDHARNTARDAMAEMIALLDRLKQDPIESVGLVEALRRQCEALGYQTGALVTTRFGELPAGERVTPGAITSILRIAQEALANVARHARAKNVWVDLGINPASAEFVLSIRDDGQGFDVTSPHSGMGLSNMQARAAEIGGRLGIRSNPDEGSSVTLRVPLLDPGAERYRYHQRRIIAVLIPAGFMGLMAVVWPGLRPNALPILALGAAIAVWQTWALVRLRWR